jgi:hypothetical protein
MNLSVSKINKVNKIIKDIMNDDNRFYQYKISVDIMKLSEKLLTYSTQMNNLLLEITDENKDTIFKKLDILTNICETLEYQIKILKESKKNNIV